MRVVPRALLAAACLAVAGGAVAETRYVTDSILLGIHQAPSEDSTIVESIPTGTPVEVTARRDGFAQVRTDSGSRGWVLADYLMAQQPARVLLDALGSKQKEILHRLAALKRQLADKEQALAALQAKTAAAPPAETPEAKQPTKADRAPAPAASQALAEAKAQVEHLRARVAELEEAARRPPAPAAAPGHDSGETVARLQRENTALRARIASAQSLLAGKGVPSADQLAGLRPGVPVWFYGAMVVALALGFIGGASWFDRRSRRRHGGFRV